ncbi:excalibur calcium-binding domain-containing protein [Oceanobacillus longus]|uniref:Excalibur calcium-binding domain-containing protein n=1 Tax=Oceanobacillus longus TaxID=930120 RepID=A0ABV8H2B0_9BACI
MYILKVCTSARNAGAAPVRSCDPGYASHFDRERRWDWMNIFNILFNKTYIILTLLML